MAQEDNAGDCRQAHDPEGDLRVNHRRPDGYVPALVYIQYTNDMENVTSQPEKGLSRRDAAQTQQVTSTAGQGITIGDLLDSARGNVGHAAGG